MYRGKQVCQTLKDIRKQIADANEIVYQPTECRHEGDCAGTCPKCEQEMRYIEKQLDARRMLGKAVTVVGISVGLGALSSCASCLHRNNLEPLAGEVMAPPPTESPDSQEVQEGAKKVNSMVVQTDTLAESVILGDVMEVMPTFPGGQEAMKEYISKNLRYTEEMEGAVSGRVIVTVTIQEDGSVTDAKVVKSLDPACDKEALRLVNSMPRWKPGEQNGKPVAVKYSIPISFTVR